MRRNVRRGMKELTIGALDGDALLAAGGTAFCDTRARNGLSDGTVAHFVQRYAKHARCRGHVYFGAWKNEQLAAFLAVIEVADWAYIEGCFSMNAWLSLRPNDALLYRALSHYLTKRRFAGVCFGSSSAQAGSNVAGLHAFKTKVGFVPRPVHRACVLNPIVRPFVNPLTHRFISALLRLRPKDRSLLKALGMMGLVLRQADVEGHGEGVA
jgi:hypothetical protein